MDVPMYFQDEAKICLRLADAEADSEVKAVLMGMAFGWLNLASISTQPFNSPVGTNTTVLGPQLLS
jgi:hypothetical protein